ncbi:MAG: flagellar assembly protein FliW [Armatimonadetes bacterium]|nr:flagellar assembly protein FliW [Armatimonadota bacterium]
MTTSIVKTARFGEISVESEDIVAFAEGLVGLPELREFVLVRHRDESPFRWLQSLDDGSVAFLVVDPQQYVPNFAPMMPESAAIALELNEETPTLVYTICSIPNGNPKGMTMNLAGPIVINAESRKARQVVLEDGEYPVRHPVFEQAAEAA